MCVLIDSSAGVRAVAAGLVIILGVTCQMAVSSRRSRNNKNPNVKAL